MTDCIFCKIAAGEIPSKKVYEDSSSMAFLDINPRNQGHTLVIPKRHSQDIFTIPEGDAAELMKAITRVAKGVVKATGAKGVTVTQNNGQLAGQVVPHIHFHIIPRTEAEKGVALEGILPVKKQEEAELDAMAAKIMKSIPKPAANPVPQEKPKDPEPEPVMEEVEPAREESPKSDSSDDNPDRQKINFDF